MISGSASWIWSQFNILHFYSSTFTSWHRSDRSGHPRLLCMMRSLWRGGCHHPWKPVWVCHHISGCGWLSVSLSSAPLSSTFCLANSAYSLSSRAISTPSGLAFYLSNSADRGQPAARVALFAWAFRYWYCWSFQRPPSIILWLNLVFCALCSTWNLPDFQQYSYWLYYLFLWNWDPIFCLPFWFDLSYQNMQPFALSPNRFLLYSFLSDFRRFVQHHIYWVGLTWCLSRESHQRIILLDFVKIGFGCSWPFQALIWHLWQSSLCFENNFVRGPIFRSSCFQ